jgi:hypothetical protein
MQTICKKVQHARHLYNFIKIRRIFMRSPCTTLYLYCNFKFDPCNAICLAICNSIIKLKFTRQCHLLQRSSLCIQHTLMNFWTCNSTSNAMWNNVMTRSDYLIILSVWERWWIELKASKFNDNSCEDLMGDGMMEESDDAFTTLECKWNKNVLKSRCNYPTPITSKHGLALIPNPRILTNWMALFIG